MSAEPGPLKRFCYPLDFVGGSQVWWGPNRRRSGPHHYLYFGLEISLIVRFRPGVPVRCRNTAVNGTAPRGHNPWELLLPVPVGSIGSGANRTCCNDLRLSVPPAAPCTSPNCFT